MKTQVKMILCFSNYYTIGQDENTIEILHNFTFESTIDKHMFPMVEYYQLVNMKFLLQDRLQPYL